MTNDQARNDQENFNILNPDWKLIFLGFHCVIDTWSLRF